MSYALSVVSTACPTKQSQWLRVDQLRVAQRRLSSSKRLVMASAGKSEKVTFVNASGEKLVGRLHTFADGGERISILCHGFRNTKDSRTIKCVADALHAKGARRHATLCFDFNGNGESEGDFEIGNYMDEVEDLRAAVVFVRGTGNEVGCVMGHSKAGGVVLLYGSQYQDVDVIINVSGRYHMKRGIEERFGPENMNKIEAEGFILQKDRLGEYKVTKESIEERRNLDMSTVANIRAKVLTIHGTKDAVIPVVDAQEFDDLFADVEPPCHTLQIIEEADHVFTQHGKELGEAVVSYLESAW
eukprot:176044-Prorocentrum_minimum.AAC.2